MKVDDRFSAILHDRRFIPIRAKQRKVKIDGRFKSMFTDPRFKLQYRVDKRGFPATESSNENLKKYYRLPKKSSSRSCEKRLEQRQRLTKLLNEEKAIEHSVEDISSDDTEESSSDESDGEASSETEPDLARGDGNVESSTDEENSDEEESNSEQTLSHDWGELDADAPRSEDISRRLALCNLDWDKVKAVDLLVLLNSFKPPRGTVKRVTIYPSEYGAKRLAEETKQGPAEFRSNNGDVDEDSDEKNAMRKNEDAKYQMEKLREYQLNRLKYYYAVVECDSPGTADAIYQECDGMEYESSATKLDIRFVPDDITFDEKPKDSADRMPDKDQYTPPEFVTTALTQSKVDLTWDETDHKRLAVTMRKFTEKELENLDLKEFLASSSGSDEELEDCNSKAPIMSLSRATTEDQIARYRSLLLGDDELADDKASDVDMEMTWVPDPSELKDVKDADDDDDDDDVPSEDETEKLPVKKSRKRSLKNEESFEVDEKQKAELEMIMMDNEDSKKKHFNMDELIKQEQKSKRKRKRQDENDKQEDNFQIDLSDSRFSALYTSPEFALDPNNPAFKDTKAMKMLIHERQSRLNSTVAPDDHNSAKKQLSEEDGNDAGLSALISSIKAKTKIRLSKRNKKA